MTSKIFAGLIIFIALAVSGGCTPATPSQTALPIHPPVNPTPTALSNPPPGPIILQYIGHSCILVSAPDGTRIISDPYESNHPSGLASFPDGLAADVVTVSHSHPDHSNISSDILAAMENADVIIVDIMGDAVHPLKDELEQYQERNVS